MQPEEPTLSRAQSDTDAQSLYRRFSGTLRKDTAPRSQSLMTMAIEDTPETVDTVHAKQLEVEVSAENETRHRRFKEGYLFPAGFVDESNSIFRVSGFIVMTQLSLMMLAVTAMMFCGHIGETLELDGAALGNSIIAATTLSVANGLGTACDTFFSQCYGGPNKPRMGVFLQRACCIYSLILCVIVPFHLNVEAILIFIGQNPLVARLAADYVLFFIPGTISYFMFVVLNKFIQNQNFVLPSLIIGLVSNLINIFMHYTLLFIFKLGIRGSAIAQSCAYTCMITMTLSHIITTSRYRICWTAWSYECMRRWGGFCRYAIPGMLMVTLSMWGFQAGLFLSGLLGVTEMGAASVLMELTGIWLEILLGVQIASSIRVGQYLGSGDAPGAVTSARVAICHATIMSIVAGIMFYIFRRQLTHLFTNVETISDMAADIMYIISIYLSFDGVVAGCKAVLYATGRQLLGACLVLSAYIFVFIPITIPLMFYSPMGMPGFWWGLAANVFFQAVVLFCIVFWMDWSAEAKEAKSRATTSMSVHVLGSIMPYQCDVPWGKRIVTISVFLTILLIGILIRILWRPDRSKLYESSCVSLRGQAYVDCRTTLSQVLLL